MSGKLTREQKRAKQKKEQARERQARIDSHGKARKAVESTILSDADGSFLSSNFISLLAGMLAAAGQPSKHLAEQMNTPAWGCMSDAILTKVNLQVEAERETLSSGYSVPPLSSAMYSLWEDLEEPSIGFVSMGLLALAPCTLDESITSHSKGLIAQEDGNELMLNAYLFGIPLNQFPDYFVVTSDGVKPPDLFYVNPDKGLIYLGHSEKAMTTVKFFGRALKADASADPAIMAIDRMIESGALEVTPATRLEYAEKLKPVLDLSLGALAHEKEILSLSASKLIKSLYQGRATAISEVKPLQDSLREANATSHKLGREKEVLQARLDQALKKNGANPPPTKHEATSKTAPLEHRMQALFH